jgi:Ferritin-like domain
VEDRLSAGVGRRKVIVAAGAAAVGLVGGGVVAAGAASSSAGDVGLLNSALVLEELQAAFYARALQRAGLTGELEQFARVVGGHERAHVAFLRRTLGPHARRSPLFEFGSAVSSPKRFAETARLLEDLGVAAYDGQALGLSKPALASVARVVSVEARHAAWIRDLLDELPAPEAANPADSAARVAEAVTRTGFVKGAGNG